MNQVLSGCQRITRSLPGRSWEAHDHLTVSVTQASMEILVRLALNSSEASFGVNRLVKVPHGPAVIAVFSLA